MTRARRVISRGPTRVVGKFPSLKSGRYLHWESQLERDRMHMLEFDPDVLAFREQPQTYLIELGDSRCRYTPDLEVQRRSGVVIEEVKPAHRVSDYADLFAAMPRVAASEGKLFSVVTDAEIRREPYLSNIKYLLRFRRHVLPQEVVHHAVRISAEEGQIAFGRLEGGLASIGVPAWCVWALLSNHYFTADLDLPLSATTLLTLNVEASSCLPLH